MKLHGTSQEGPFLWCTGTQSNLTLLSIRQQWYSSDPQHSGCSFWSSGHLRCKDLRWRLLQPPWKITDVYMTPVLDASLSTEVSRWQSSVETRIWFHHSQRHPAALCQHRQIPPVELPVSISRAAGLTVLLIPCLNSYGHGSKLTTSNCNQNFRAKVWTMASEFASIKYKLNAPSLSSQHTRLCIKSTLYFCSSWTTRRINCPTTVANTSSANKLQKDSWGTRYRTRQSWGRPGKTQKVFRGL